MYPSIDLLLEEKPVLENHGKKQSQLPYIKAKLRDYAMKNDNARDKRLLECHAHCFISLS